MPHVPDTVPGKRAPGAGARTEGRGQPSNINSLPVVATDVVQAADDKQQIEPMLGQLATLPTDLGRPQPCSATMAISVPPMS